MLESIVLYVLMAAPAATGDHSIQYAVPLGVYASPLDCAEAASWIDEQGSSLPRHLFCIPVQNDQEGETYDLP